MGRVKTQIPRATFAMKSGLNKKGESAIYIRYFIQGKYARRSTEIFLAPEDWDDAKQEVKTSHKQHALYNSRMRNLRQRIDDELSKLADAGPITYNQVQKVLDGSTFEVNVERYDGTFVEYANEVNELHYSKGKYGYSVYYNNKCNIKQFDKYLRIVLKKSDFEISDLNLDVINKYIKYRQEVLENTSNEGINKTLTPLLNAVKYALANGVVDSRFASPIIEGAYIDLKDRTYSPDDNTKSKIRYLNSEQFKALSQYKPKNNRSDRTAEFLDIFFFAYYACGLRVSDIITLEWSQIDFENNIIDKTQVKTKKKGKIQPHISKEGMDILERWKKKKLNSRFVFNLLPEDYKFNDEHDFKMRLNSMDRVLNQSLNAVGKNLDLPFSLTMHVARHTFCVNSISEGLSLHIISQLMGHSSILATEKTYAEYLDETVNKEMEKIDAMYKSAFLSR